MEPYEKVYREIDRFTSQLQARTGKDIKTWGEVFDRPTVMALHRLLRVGALKSIDYPVKTGKEANVFKGTSGDGEDVAIKIYRVATATFRHMLKYIEGDPRFRNVPRDHRALVYAWARKEYRNLERFREANVDVPIPYRCLNNIVIMEYLSNEDGPARTMKEQPPAHDLDAFEKLWGDYQRLLSGARSIHADFSEYNVLMPRGEPRIIDVGQAILDTHPMAPEFLERDLRGFAKFFRGRDVEADASELLGDARAIIQSHQDEEFAEEPF